MKILVMYRKTLELTENKTKKNKYQENQSDL